MQDVGRESCASKAVACPGRETGPDSTETGPDRCCPGQLIEQIMCMIYCFLHDLTFWRIRRRILSMQMKIVDVFIRPYPSGHYPIRQRRHLRCAHARNTPPHTLKSGLQIVHACYFQAYKTPRRSGVIDTAMIAYVTVCALECACMMLLSMEHACAGYHGDWHDDDMRRHASCAALHDLIR